MDFKHLFALSLTLFCGWGARANDDTPVINPVFTYTDSNGTRPPIAGQLPLSPHFLLALNMLRDGRPIMNGDSISLGIASPISSGMKNRHPTHSTRQGQTQSSCMRSSLREGTPYPTLLTIGRK